MLFSFADGVQDIQGHGNIRRFQAGTKGVRGLHGRPGKRVQRHRVLVVEKKICKYVFEQNECYNFLFLTFNLLKYQFKSLQLHKNFYRYCFFFF